MKLFAIVSVLLGLYNTGVLAIRGSELYSANSPKDNRLFGLSNPFSSLSLSQLGFAKQKELEELAAARELAATRAAAAKAAAASSRFSSFSGRFGSSYSF